MSNKAVLLITALSLTVTACAENGSKPMISNTTTGVVAGAAVGAVAGTAIVGGTVATIVGALAGAYIGGEIGKSLDDRDRKSMEQSTQTALNSSPAGKTSRWTNSESGSTGSVTPQPSYRDSKGRLCREYQETVNSKGQTQTGYRTACQESDGSWRIVNG
ncbi:RT0821/Lpp0805 family surface protein [Govanella unica]|uniref:RT0821/Lpp0805 family surface protein n=1 Tax=Govanella unica TaxID=2975056 RepID=A0A9X3TYI8_9PROT|nr:RT0821/Lpp0805 family surface protein [Govania unica]MDA5194037.1 RT0821/Lpp0805 family surface protein [Govania unica]